MTSVPRFSISRKPARELDPGRKMPRAMQDEFVQLPRRTVRNISLDQKTSLRHSFGRISVTPRAPLNMSKPGDAPEQEADQVAEAVIKRPPAGGGIGHVLGTMLMRQGAEKSSGEEEKEKYREAAKKVGEAFLETKLGKTLTDQAKEKGEEFIKSAPGMVITGIAAEAAVTALAVANKELPIGLPEIPLDKLHPGLKMKITYEGPVLSPTKAMITFSGTFGGPEEEKKPGMTKSETEKAKTTKLAAEMAAFREMLKTPEQKKAEKEAWMKFMAEKYGPKVPGAEAGVPAISSSVPSLKLTPLTLEYKKKSHKLLEKELELEIPGIEIKPEEETEKIKKEEEKSLQRKPLAGAEEHSSPADAPPIVHKVLRSPGQALDVTTRGFMESRFGFDFSQVRVHTDSEASESAIAVNARAYTSGINIAFKAGQYAPGTTDGRALLAHELAHVVQQTASSPPRTTIQRAIWTEAEQKERELEEFLKAPDEPRPFYPFFELATKHDMARKVVEQWKAGNYRFNLTAQEKGKLIKVLLDGFSAAEDHMAILDLLELSENGDLRYLFTDGGIRVAGFESRFGKSERARLDRFFEQRFEGGKAKVQAAEVNPKGGPGKGAPRFGFSWWAFKARIEGAYTSDELYAQVKALSESQRNNVIKNLLKERILLDQFIKNFWDAHQPKNDAEKKLYEKQINPKKEQCNKIDQVLEALYRDVALATDKTLLEYRTKTLTPEQKGAARTALKLEVKKGAAGESLKFQNDLPGDSKSYEDKVREAVPGVLQDYYDRLAAGKEHKEEYLHKPEDLQEVANVSKDETDLVFGRYKKGKAFRVSKPGKRGNILDWWKETEKRNKTKWQRKETARFWIFWILQNDARISYINRLHNASPDFSKGGKPVNEEAKILQKIGSDILKNEANVKRLYEIGRAWPAVASGAEVNIQMFKKSLPKEDRKFLWDLFYTIIHEYLHTLAHSKYDAHAEKLGGEKSAEGNTLIEGVDSLLTETVWANARPRSSLKEVRDRVEGELYRDLPFDASLLPPYPSHRYPSFNRAIKLVDIVGIHNLYAAYFLGKVELIGK